MAYQKKSYKNKSKSTRRPKRTYKRRPLTIAPFPPSKLVRLRYVDNFALNPSLTTPATAVFRANGMYDPDASGGGHQPLGYDQFSVLYDHARVIGAKMTVTFFPTDLDTVVGIYLDDDYGGIGLLSNTLEQPNTRKRYCAGGSERAVSVTQYFSADKFLGKAAARSDSNKQQLGIADPSEEVYFHIFTYSAASGGDPASQNVIVNIEYIAMLSEPKTLASS